MEAMLNIVNNGKIDGIINWSSSFTWIVEKKNFKEFFNKAGENPNFLKLTDYPENMPVIVLNSYEGIRKIMIHLIKVHGAKKIAFIKGPAKHKGAIERFKAYKDALEESGLPFDPDIAPDPPEDKRWNELIGEEIAYRILDKKKKDLDAIVCFNDILCSGALTALNKRGIKAPNDILITGFDNNTASSFNIPSITTIDPNFEEVGRLTIETFYRLFTGKETSLKQFVQPKLIIRQSCGCLNYAAEQAGIVIDNTGGINISGKAGDDYDKVLKEITETKQFAGSINAFKILFKSFTDIIGGKDQYQLILRLNEELQTAMSKGDDMLPFHQFFSVLYNKIIVNIEDRRLMLKLEMLMQQIRIIIDQAEKQVYIRIKEYDTFLFNRLDNIGKELVAAFNLKTLLNLITENIFFFGIKTCFLSLFESKEQCYLRSRLLLAFINNKRFDVDDEGIIFKTGEIIPEQFDYNAENFNFIIQPLYFNEEQLGYIIFDIGLKNGLVYERLRHDISSAVKGALLVEEMEKRTKELDTAYKELKENQEILLITEKMASLGRLTAGIAHEMNTPLSVIMSSMEELKSLIAEYNASINNPGVSAEDHASIAKDMNKYVDMSIKAVERNVEFIKGIKGQSMMNSSVIMEKFNVGETIKDALILMEFRIRKYDCRLESNLDNGVYLRGNPRWISQIITNLVNNAVDACSKNHGLIKVKLFTRDQDVLLTVEDNGEGISPENISKIFEPLFTTKPFGRATGLGLSIVREIVNQFAGAIEVKSENGITCFTVRIPGKERS